MPPTLSLPQFSSRQIEATSGFRPRLAYADILRDELPNFYAARQAGQQNRSMDLSEQQMEQQDRLLDIQARSLASQEEAQASAQSQATIGSGIQAVGTVGQVALGAKQLGLFGGKTATGLSSTATQAPSLAVGASTGTAVLPSAASEAAMTAGGVALDTGGAATAVAATGTQAVAPTGFASLGTMAGAAGGLAAAGGGALAGSLVGPPIRKLAGGGVKGRLAGAAGGATLGGAIGAGIGTVLFPGFGTLAGAIVGGAAGGLTGGLCPIHSSSFGHDSAEVEIARLYRDNVLDKQTLKGYYSWGEPVAMEMDRNPEFRTRIRVAVVAPLIRHGAQELGMDYAKPSANDEKIALHWLAHWSKLGENLPSYRRTNGEIIT